jgi:hypothetical protein
VVEIGSCRLCGQQLLRSDDGDVWHPHDVERACPPEPSWHEPGGVAAWQEFYSKWTGTGRPGAENFVEAVSK